MVTTMQDVIGENVRRLRTGVGATHDELASYARKNLGLVGLADMLSAVTGEPIAVHELFAGSGSVLITPSMAVTRERLRQAL